MRPRPPHSARFSRLAQLTRCYPALPCLGIVWLCLNIVCCVFLTVSARASEPTREAAAGQAGADASTTPSTDWRSLFDGQSFEGWECDRDYWRVEDGALVGEIPAGQTLRKNTWLVWRDGELKDFDLRLKFRLSGAPAANSGIQFRCQVRDVDHVSGYQADLDMGATWLGRIYDEHGRALLVERGTRVHILPDGQRRRESFAPANQFAVLFRPGHWNDYRIMAVGDHVQITINGTLFAELRDEQIDEMDLRGSLALQLHSGPETKVEFKDIRLRELNPQSDALSPFSIDEDAPAKDAPVGEAPIGIDGKPVDLGFESGTLEGWKATGDAFRDQPVQNDGIASRWAGQVSNKAGEFFIGGYEIVQDAGVGTLTSVPIRVTHDYASFLLGGGRADSTRVEIVRWQTPDSPSSNAPAAGAAGEVLAKFSGNDREQMERYLVDLRGVRDELIVVRVIDENRGGWGHLNFDDFRVHTDRPTFAKATAASYRSTANPLLHHLVPNPIADDADDAPGMATLRQMRVPAGFSVDVVAAEPDLHQPMAFCFDERGRLWVVEGHSYPQKRPAGEGLDRVLIFADTNGDGTFDERKVFCEGLNLVSGMQVGYGGVWIGAAPELLFIPDADGDDVPDGEPQVLLDGFGFADTHETINSFLWGPDGWLYGNQGVFNSSAVGKPGTPAENRVRMQAGVWRYHPTRHRFEVFAHGGSNQWGLDYDAHGELFMTHCRSRWGGGPTTHVMQGGHYWNQVNGGYAPFVSANALPERPHLRNYLLASAPYGHGEGGAGRRGSRAVFGGHSHVGTMIYQADNWPASYRGHLFTHNLHGHQLNQQTNHRELLTIPHADDAGATELQGSGYQTWHTGQDALFVGDPQYIGVDLQTGPDGAVYISDWYDPRHCHNPNVELWDRGNGRIYRMRFDATYQPATVRLDQASDLELVQYQTATNNWHARTARRLLHERAASRSIDAEAIAAARQLFAGDQPTMRLRSLWLLALVDQLDSELLQQALTHEDPYVRSWAIQLGLDSPVAAELETQLTALALQESDPLVLRYLASALPRLQSQTAWQLATVIAQHAVTTSDQRLIKMLWFGIAPAVPESPTRALALASQTASTELHDYIVWYVAKTSAAGREAIVAELTTLDDNSRSARLRLLAHAVGSMRGLATPTAWRENAAAWYDASDAATRDAAETIGAAFADEALFARMRTRLTSPSTSDAAARHALSVLQADSSPHNLGVYLQLVRQGRLLDRAIPLLGGYQSPEVADVLLARLPQLEGSLRDITLGTLSSRAAWANRLLDAIDDEQVPAGLLTAYYARQIAGLGDPKLRERLTKRWGQLTPSSAETQHQIRKLVATYAEAPLWAYSAQAGATHFKKLCANCHQPEDGAASIAPKLAGSGSKGIEYLVENILDPNAVIGRDFQARALVTVDGRVITGLVEAESESSITVRTQTDSVTVAKDDVEQLRISENSFMPTGLLDQLSERERIELLKYLMEL